MEPTTDKGRRPFWWDDLGWETRFSQNLRTCREAKGWTQYELVRRVQQVGLKRVHMTTLQRIESGERAVKLSEAVALSQVLEQDLQALMEDRSVEATHRALHDAVDPDLIAAAWSKVLTVTESLEKRRSAIAELITRYRTMTNTTLPEQDAFLLKYADWVVNALADSVTSYSEASTAAEEILQPLRERAKAAWSRDSTSRSPKNRGFQKGSAQLL